MEITRCRECLTYYQLDDESERDLCHLCSNQTSDRLQFAVRLKNTKIQDFSSGFDVTAQSKVEAKKIAEKAMEENIDKYEIDSILSM